MKWHELEKSKPAFGTLCLCREDGGDDACYTLAIYQDNSIYPWLDYDDGETVWPDDIGCYWIAMDELENENEADK